MELSWLQKKQLMEITGKSVNTVSKRLSGVKSKMGQYGPEFFAPDAVAAIIAPDVQRTKTVNPSDVEYDPAQAKARLDLAKAKLAELDLRQREGEVIETSAVVHVVASILANIKNNLLGVASELAPVLARIDSQRTTQTIIADRIHDVLAELSQFKVEHMLLSSKTTTEDDAE